MRGILFVMIFLSGTFKCFGGKEDIEYHRYIFKRDECYKDDTGDNRWIQNL
jgi:hypothetical protein